MSTSNACVALLFYVHRIERGVRVMIEGGGGGGGRVLWVYTFLVCVYLVYMRVCAAESVVACVHTQKKNKNCVRGDERKWLFPLSLT